MPPKTVSLAECFNSSKESASDEDDKGTLHAGVQTRSGQAGQGRASLSATAKILGIAEQTLHNWVKADRAGSLQGPGTKPVSAEQMEIARLRAELARVKMERDILGKATAYFAKERG